jgi:hypothetical protein
VLRLRNNLKAVTSKKTVALGAVMAAVAVGLGTMSQPAQATPSGLTYYPSTDVYGRGNFHFDSDTFLNQDDTSAGAFGTSIGLSVGTGPDRDGLFGRSEVGIDYLTSGNDISVGKRFQANAKTQLFNSDEAQIRVVAGIWGLGSREAYSPNIAYVLASKNFPRIGRFHAGVARSFQKERIVGDDRTNLQLGYDRVFANGKLQFTLDYMTGDTTYGALAPGLIYYINDKAGVQVGYVRPNEKRIFGNDLIYLAFDYNFGGGRTEGAPAPPPETSTQAPANQ